MIPLVLLQAGLASDPTMQRASVATGGAQADAGSISAAVSADGRFVAFASDASNLVSPDVALRDIFVHDRQTGSTELVAVASDSSPANRSSFSPDISADGRYVVFSTEADNLATSVTTEFEDIFVHDRQTGATEHVSVASDGTGGNGDSITPSISADGRYVAFTSFASNLVPDDTNDTWDVFVRDRQAGTTELMSVASDGTHGDLSSGWIAAGHGRISSDGRYVVFGSFATNLVPNDTNARDDIFLRDRQTGVTERVSVTSGGVEGNGHSMHPSVSDDGRYVVFDSSSNDLVAVDTNMSVDVFLHDRETSTTVLISALPDGTQAAGPSRNAVISEDGRVVAFESPAANLAPEDTNLATDIFLYQVESGGLQRISEANNGSQATGNSHFASINGDGSVVAFESEAPNLASDDSNSVVDVFAWGKALGSPTTPPPAATATPTATPPPPADPGDANCSGDVSSIDAAIVLQFGAGLTGSLPCLAAADVNASGAVDAIDAALILQFVAGLLESLGT